MKKRSAQKAALNELANWLLDNKAISLAQYLDYSTPTTIYQWFYRESIPHRQLDKVLKFIRRTTHVAS